MKHKKRILDWKTEEGFEATLFWHNGGPLPGELQTARSRGIWIERNRKKIWLARSWKGAYDRMKEMGFYHE
jgi:hypothetical protein